MKKLGLISGMGELPMAIAAEASSKGYSVFAVGLEPLADRALESFVHELRMINVGKLGDVIDYLKKSGVEEVVMAGKVPKTLLYRSKISPDLRAIRLLFTLKDRSDDSILLGIANELKKDGLTLLNTTDFSTQLLTPEGVLTDRHPSEEDWKDISFGLRIAKEMGRLDIGQTVVVKNRAVMAVEAIEGTDEAIKRGGRLAGNGAVVVKVSKPQQDMRFDVPVVGSDTLKAMLEAGVTVLAIEAEKSIVVGREKLLKEANNAGIIIVGFRDNSPL
jgi:UDP-2,3-diacylglucosamine hydrolase